MNFQWNLSLTDTVDGYVCIITLKVYLAASFHQINLKVLNKASGERGALGSYSFSEISVDADHEFEDLRIQIWKLA